jgi:hypothetical protein
VGLRPLVCSAKIWYYTTVSKHQYTPLRAKRQTQRARFSPSFIGSPDSIQEVRRELKNIAELTVTAGISRITRERSACSNRAKPE